MTNSALRVEIFPRYWSWKQIENFLADGSNRAFITNTNDLYVMNLDSKGAFKYKVLPERIRSYHWGFKMHPNHFMFEVFNRKMRQLVESGIAKVLLDKEMFRKKPEDIASKEPVPLNLEHLAVWFKILLMMFYIALFILFLEVLVRKVLDMRKQQLSVDAALDGSFDFEERNEP
jgi:hypothetical protein